MCASGFGAGGVYAFVPIGLHMTIQLLIKEMEMGKFFRVLRFFLLSKALRNHDSRAKIYISKISYSISHLSLFIKNARFITDIKKKKKKEFTRKTYFVISVYIISKLLLLI